MLEACTDSAWQKTQSPIQDPRLERVLDIQKKEIEVEGHATGRLNVLLDAITIRKEGKVIMVMKGLLDKETTITITERTIEILEMTGTEEDPVDMEEERMKMIVVVADLVLPDVRILLDHHEHVL